MRLIGLAKKSRPAVSGLKTAVTHQQSFEKKTGIDL
jgi:hypothetical protein